MAASGAGGGLRALRRQKQDAAASSAKRMSTRSTHLLREIADKGETFGLPDEKTAPDNLVWCKVEFPNSKSFGDSYERFKYFIIHCQVRDGLFKGGHFRIAIDLRASDGYPFHPPKARMLTQIWHPNFDLNGGICHSHLKLPGPPANGSWIPGLRISGLIDGLLLSFDVNSDCFYPKDPLNHEAAEQFLKNRSSYEAQAREWVARHAKPMPIEPDDLAKPAAPSS